MDLRCSRWGSIEEDAGEEALLELKVEEEALLDGPWDGLLLAMVSGPQRSQVSLEKAT